MKFPILVLDSQETLFNPKAFTEFTGLNLEPSLLTSNHSAKGTVIFTDLNRVLLHRTMQAFLKEISIRLKENSEVILLLHKDLIESKKLGVLEFLKSKCGTVFDYKNQKFTVSSLKSLKKGFQHSEHHLSSSTAPAIEPETANSLTYGNKTGPLSSTKSPSTGPTLQIAPTPMGLGHTMNLNRSENATKAKNELVLPHTAVISQADKQDKGLIYYSHDLLDALDDEDDDLDF